MDGCICVKPCVCTAMARTVKKTLRMPTGTKNGGGKIKLGTSTNVDDATVDIAASIAMISVIAPAVCMPHYVALTVMAAMALITIISHHGHILSAGRYLGAVSVMVLITHFVYLALTDTVMANISISVSTPVYASMITYILSRRVF